MLSLNNIELKEFTGNAITSYIIAWIYFFISLPIAQHIFGKVKGTIINYGISWLIWVLVVNILHEI